MDWKFLPIQTPEYRESPLVAAGLKMFNDNLNLNRQMQFKQQNLDRDHEFKREAFDYEKGRNERFDPLKAKGLEVDTKAKLAELGLLPGKAALSAAQLRLIEEQIKQAQKKDEFEQFILDSMRPQQPQGAPPPSPSLVRPQSFGPTPERPAIMSPATMGVAPPEPAGDPMLIPTQAAPGAPQQPQAPAQQRDDPIVQTPMGPMPASKARQIGFALAYKGRADAGKMISDAANPNMLGKEARNEIDKNELKATDALSRMKAIRQGVQPEFLTLEEQARQYGISWIDSIDALRKKLPPEEIAKHTAFVKFKRDTVENLNQHILDFTGAAMGRDEVPRLMGAVPTMNDGPTAFMAKLEGVVRQKELAIARYRYLRTYGFNGQPWDGNVETAARALPLERMKGIILEDSKRTFQQIRQQLPDAGEDQIRAATRAAIRQRYGMDI